MAEHTIDLRDGHLPVAAGLAQKYSGLVPAAAVDDIVREAWDDLAAEARFTTYLAVLTRRVADQRLREQLDAAST